MANVRFWRLPGAWEIRINSSHALAAYHNRPFGVSQPKGRTPAFLSLITLKDPSKTSGEFDSGSKTGSITTLPLRALRRMISILPLYIREYPPKLFPFLQIHHGVDP